LHKIFLIKETEVNGIKFCAYTAGHVLGAAMFMIEIAGVKVRESLSFSPGVTH
jgi:cleavage and polyadenylation specificity factor subunit 3